MAFTQGASLLLNAEVNFRIAMTALALLPPDGSLVAEQGTAVPSRQAALGQFMTPPRIAAFMVEQFDPAGLKDVHLLDAGAGQGALSMAFARHWSEQAKVGRKLHIEAFELDPAMVVVLRRNFGELETVNGVTSTVIPGDFLANGVARVRDEREGYSHAILNPPYKKIGSASRERRTLASVGIETVNLYSGFFALAIKMLRPGGELVAIVPRSFCNGPYYKSFRNFVLSNTAILGLHLIVSRDKAFAEDGVLQETVIIHLRKGASQGAVHISTSTDGHFTDVNSADLPFTAIVAPDDKERFIHVPTGRSARSQDANASSTLGSLHLAVSTGPVVDFRVKRHLRAMPEPGTVPLLYPGHFGEGRLEWPRAGFRKANALALNADTSRWLYPTGYYVVVRRFSPKEERRRIVATLIDPTVLPGGPIGVENHLNIFHRNRGPLSENVARGLMLYLNAKSVDDRFREFNGHTQVNATDLRSLPYPDLARLDQLGEWSKRHPQADYDQANSAIGPSH